MVRAYSLLSSVLLLSTLCLPTSSAGTVPFKVAVLVEEGTKVTDTCTSEELAVIESAIQFSIVQRGNKHFGTQYDFELADDLVDTDPDDFDATELGTDAPSGEWEGRERRELVRFFRFVYGGEAAMICRYCDSDQNDGRRLGGRNKSRKMKGLFRAMTNQVWKDVAADYADYFLAPEGVDYGCLGDGTKISTVFEMVK